MRRQAAAKIDQGIGKQKALQEKYKDDQEKLNQKLQELYRKEGVNPMGSCLPMLISMVILFAMFYALRTFANEQLVSQFLTFYHNPEIDPHTLVEPFLWIKNLWMPDSPFHPIIADSSSLRMIPADVWAKVFAVQPADAISKLAALGIDANTISGDTVFAALQALPTYASEVALWPTLPTLNLLITRLSIYSHNSISSVQQLSSCYKPYFKIFESHNYFKLIIDN